MNPSGWELELDDGRRADSTRDLSAIDEQVERLFALVADGVVAASLAFLEGDAAAGARIVEADDQLDRLQTGVEAMIHDEFMAVDPLGESDVRYLLCVVRIVPELERSGDLVEHIAVHAGQGLARQLSPRCRALLGEMGRTGAEMWRVSARAFAERDGGAVDELRRRDDDLDDLHVDLTAELAASPLSVAAAIEMGLVARYFERLGDHAVNVTSRISYLVG